MEGIPVVPCFHRVRRLRVLTDYGYLIKIAWKSYFIRHTNEETLARTFKATYDYRHAIFLFNLQFFRIVQQFVAFNNSRNCFKDTLDVWCEIRETEIYKTLLYNNFSLFSELNW